MGVVLDLICHNIAHGEQQLSSIIFGVLPIAQDREFPKTINVHQGSLLRLEDILTAKATLESDWMCHTSISEFKTVSKKFL
jgi:hypothetical protein